MYAQKFKHSNKHNPFNGPHIYSVKISSKHSLNQNITGKGVLSHD